ncbi:MAG: MFS transporter [Pseudonocardia sp.]|nr:MFS transporter [Pseudonocardia sp.]
MGGSQPVDPGRWRALAVCLVAGFMALLDVSIVNVALPSLQRELDASSAELSWVISGYALTFGLVLVASGRLGDDHGRKKMFILSLGLFTLTSLVAGFAPNAISLVIIRLFQGATAGMLSPQITGFIQQLFRGPERGRAFGMFGAVVSIATAIGPLLGGLLLEAGGPIGSWRYVFWVNVPIGLAALALALRLLPRDAPSTARQPLDVVGSALLGGAVVALMLPLVLAEQGPSSAPWWLLGVCVVLLGGFVVWERRCLRAHGQPLVDFGMLRIRSYSLGSLLILLYFAGFTSIFFVLTLYYQQGHDYSPLAAGLALTPFAVGSGVASVVGGRLVERHGRALAVGGLGVVLVGLIATEVVLRFDPAHVGWFTALPLLVAGVGSGLVIAPNQTLTLNEIPPAKGGTAAGVMQTGQRIGTAVGISVVAAIFFGRLRAGGGDYGAAISTSLIVVMVFVACALVVGLLDLRLRRRRPQAATAA